MYFLGWTSFLSIKWHMDQLCPPHKGPPFPMQSQECWGRGKPLRNPPRSTEDPKKHHLRCMFQNLMGWNLRQTKLGGASCDNNDSRHSQALDRVPLVGTGVRCTCHRHGHFLRCFCSVTTWGPTNPPRQELFSVLGIRPYLLCFTKITHIPGHTTGAFTVDASVLACEGVQCTCLISCIKFRKPLFQLRIWNPSTPTYRTHSLPSTHLLRPRQPRCSGSCSAWPRSSTVGTGCAASWTSSSQPRGPCSTCSGRPAWVPPRGWSPCEARPLTFD